MPKEGLLIVISGPSGTGKGTILRHIRENNKDIRFSVSATTREPRSGEVHGINYFFKSSQEFEEMIQSDDLIEWVSYCGNYYGTPRKYIEDILADGYDCILEIDVAGALNIKKKYPNCVSVFVLPPSFKELKRRITDRGTESPEIIEMRLKTAKYEMTFVDKYDYAIINDHIEKVVTELEGILMAEKLKFARNINILEQLGLDILK
jgi:guanylate kinase